MVETQEMLDDRAGRNGLAALADALDGALPSVAPAHPAATAVAGRVLTLSSASAEEQRKLAHTLREEAAANCAMLDGQMKAYSDAIDKEKQAIETDAERIRRQAQENCARLNEQAKDYCTGLTSQKEIIFRDAEQRAKELEAVADKIESSAEGVAKYLEDYANTLATVGEHTEDLHNRLKPPVPHGNGR